MSLLTTVANAPAPIIKCECCLTRTCALPTVHVAALPDDGLSSKTISNRGFESEYQALLGHDEEAFGRIVRGFARVLLVRARGQQEVHLLHVVVGLTLFELDSGSVEAAARAHERLEP